MTTRAHFGKTLVCYFLLVLVPLCVFLPSVLRDEFVNWDDEGQLYQNADFNPPSFQSVGKYWYSTHMNLYMPITYTLWGSVACLAQVPASAEGIRLNPVWFHALNLALHCGAALAVFAILRLLIENIWAALAGAMVFAVHPIQTEAVCWASGMYTVLSSLLIFLALAQYIRFLKTAGTRANIHYIIASAFFIAAMLSKPSAVVAILMAALLDFYIRRSMKRLVGPLIGWFVVAIPILVILHFSQPAAIVPDQPLWFRPVVLLDSIGFYLAKIVFPINFAVDYNRSPSWLAGHPLELWMALLAVVVGGLAWVQRRKWPLLLLGLALLVAALLPFLGLIKFDFQHFSTVADRYAYPGMLGIALVAGAAVNRAPKTPIRIIVGLILVGLAARTYAQTTAWTDTRALFTHNLVVNPASLQAHSNLGFLDMQAHRVDEAIEHSLLALKTDPSDPDANTDLGNALASKGDFNDAVDHFNRALQTMPNDPRIHLNLGSALANLREYPQAAREFEIALSDDEMNHDPGLDVRAAAHANLGLIFEQFGQVGRAKLEYQAALAVDRNFVLARRGLARINSGR